ncbi:hypothetical protein NAU58_21070 [Pseudomonas stutzeri]|uniref:hypothetical protein n=1 Tax=Stutzerimonas stutzeri TaxID=316 RepID=UPI00210BF6D2|nr:hypothetical protein [Stutzerimonas stutzeri]MCQ4298073.1 hypothetical protein [Stutzerimonas stutzeri]
MKKLSIITAAVLLSNQASAAPAWYSGKITRVWPQGGAFIVTLDSTALDDCQHKYAYFQRATLGEKLYSETYALALSSMAMQTKFGIVIDKLAVGAQCNATSADVRQN